MGNAADAAFRVVGHHPSVRIGNAVGNGPAGLEGLFNPAAKFAEVPGILVVAGVALVVVAAEVRLEAGREGSPIGAGWQLDCEQAIGKAVTSLLERGLDLPVHITAAVGAASNENNRDSCKADALFPDPSHHVVRVGAFDEVVLVRNADVSRNEGALEFLEELLGFTFVKVAGRSSPLSSEGIRPACSRDDLPLPEAPKKKRSRGCSARRKCSARSRM